ncbi:MAG: CoA pyrophosphatase [Candidatus Nanohaloarchaea archaeon]|nr:CoA pyrophosphatase [Candidatus Nanohaloarchaea archaeon]
MTEERDSAVLIPVDRRDSGDRILFTKRSEELPDHAGHVSFPGGKREPEDADLLETALRETREEVGIEEDCIDIGRELEPHYTKTSGYRIQPYAGELDGEYEIETGAEVDEMFYRDVEDLEQQYDPETAEFAFDDYRIWGATARILSTFLEEEYDSGGEGGC